MEAAHTGSKSRTKITNCQKKQTNKKNPAPRVSPSLACWHIFLPIKSFIISRHLWLNSALLPSFGVFLNRRFCPAQPLLRLAESFRLRPICARRYAPGWGSPPISRGDVTGREGSSATFDGLFSFWTGVNKQQQYFPEDWRPRFPSASTTDETNKGGRPDTRTSPKLHFSSFVVTSDSSRGSGAAPGHRCLAVAAPGIGWARLRSSIRGAFCSKGRIQPGGAPSPSGWEEGKRVTPAAEGMTALAGSIPRMMRPTLAQNYPRSGFPLEGKSINRRAAAFGDGWFYSFSFVRKSEIMESYLQRDLEKKDFTEPDRHVCSRICWILIRNN